MGCTCWQESYNNQANTFPVEMNKLLLHLRGCSVLCFIEATDGEEIVLFSSVIHFFLHVCGFLLFCFVLFFNLFKLVWFERPFCSVMERLMLLSDIYVEILFGWLVFSWSDAVVILKISWGDATACSVVAGNCKMEPSTNYFSWQF